MSPFPRSTIRIGSSTFHGTRFMTKLCSLLFLLSRLTFAGAAEQADAPISPVDDDPDHAIIEVHGWTIHLHDRLVAESPEPTNRMLELLNVQLQRVVDAVPEPALRQLRQIPIWINPPYEGRRGIAEYHPHVGWLKKNGRNPAMGRAIEITNVKNFPFEDRRMPYLLLHELAHGYHDRILEGGYGNAEIRAAYERAREQTTSCEELELREAIERIALELPG